MSHGSAARKAWNTMRGKSPAERAHITRRRRKGAKEAAEQVKRRQWEPGKVEYLRELAKKSTSGACVVCDDSRPVVLHRHHVDRRGKHTVTLCANCHDIVRRGTSDDLKKAHEMRRR